MTTTVEENPYSFLLRQNAYSAASTAYKDAHREAIVGDADMLAVGEYLFMQSRIRHTIRNNPIASSAMDKFATSLGALKVNWKTKDGHTHKLMQELWDEFTQNPCLDGKGDFNSLQATWNCDRFQSGEALARLLIVKKNNTNRVKLKIQPIESEYLDISYTGWNYDENSPYGRTRYGITFDKATSTKPEIYHFFKDRYYGVGSPTNPQVRIPVNANEVIHIFERRRSNQWRGIPTLACCLLALYEIEDLCSATVAAQNSASAITWIVEEQNDLTSDPTGVVQMRGRRYTNDVEKQLHFAATGGGVQYTKGKFNLVQSRDIGSNLVALLREEYQKISSALNLPYYQLSGDTSGMDFSSLRGILINLRERVEFIYQTVNIPDGLAPIAKHFKMLASIDFDVSDAIASYQYPIRYGVDPLKDAQTDALEFQTGLETLSKILIARGSSLEEIAADRLKLKELGLEDLLIPKQGTATNQKEVKAARNKRTNLTDNNSGNIKPKSNTTGS